MTKATDYIAEAGHYLGTDADVLEPLTDAQFDALVEATDLRSGGGTEPGIDTGLVRTHETLADFNESRKGWTQLRDFSAVEFGDFRAVHYEGVQMFKGQPRHDFIVVDLGDFRVVVK